MEIVVSILVAILISFIVNWLLTLVIVVFELIIIGAGLLHASHYKKNIEGVIALPILIIT